jgi:hypothetical protein
MKMEQFNHRKTPLGEKFDNADFPIEPHAWDDMEGVLAAEKVTQLPPLSIWGSKMLLVVALAGMGLVLWYKKQQINAKMDLTQASTSAPIKTLSSTSDGINARSLIVQNQEFTTSALVNKADVSAVSPMTLAQQAGESSKTYKLLESYTQREINSIANSVVSKENGGVFSNGEKTDKPYSKETKTDNLEKINAPNSVSTMPKNASNDMFLSEKSASAPPQYFEQNLALKEEERTKNMEETDKNGVENTQLSKNVSSLDTVQKMDNPANTLGNDLQNTLFFPLELLTPDYVYSTTDYNSSHYQTLKNLSETTLIPISKLVKGARHQLDFGLGTATFNAPKYLNHFRVGYQYRLTPLFGVGASANYAVKKEGNDINGFTFTGELEGLLYFVNRRKIDFIVSAGYGYRQWKNLGSGVEDSKGKGFTLGLVLQYRPNNQWVTGLRFDTKELKQFYQDPAIVLTLGRRF